MTDKEKVKVLSKAFEEVIWMAIRYADGRHTYAPSAVRDAVKMYQSVHPDWKPREDITITKPSEEEVWGMSMASDYLWDLVGSK